MIYSETCPECGHIMTVETEEGEKSYYTKEDCQNCGHRRSYGADKKEST